MPPKGRSKRSARKPTKATRPAPRKTTKKTTRKTARTAKPKARKTTGRSTTRRGTTKTTKKPTRPRRSTKTAQQGDPDPNTITLQPMLVVPDVVAEQRFLESLGFQTVMAMPGPGGAPMHVVLNMGNAMVHLDPVDMPGPPMPPGRLADRVENNRRGPRGLGFQLYVMVDNVDKVAKKLGSLKADILQPVMDQFWGDRTIMAYDPAGYLWSFAQNVKQVSPEEMGKALEQMAAAPI